LFQRELGHTARVAFIARECPAYAASWLAISNIRGVTIPMNPDLPPAKLITMLRETQATHVAVTNDLQGRVREWLQANRLSLPLIEIERKQGGEFDSVYSPPAEHVPLDTDIVLLLPSAGAASGKNRWAAFNHKQVIAMATAPRSLYAFKGGDRFLSFLGWAHPFAFVHGLLLPLLNGACCVLNPGLENKALLEFLARNLVNRLVGSTPSLVHLLLICKNEKQTLPSIRSVTPGLGPMNAEIRKIFSLMKIAVLGCYGQVEAGWTLTMDTRGLPGFNYRVLDPHGDEIEGDDTREGLLAVMGPSTLTGFPGHDADTQQALRGTWLHTGDFARLEGIGEELRIHFLARKQEVILPGVESRVGRPILCDGVDAIARSIPGVQDAAGFPLDKAGGKTVLACAVVKVTGNSLNEKTILEFCQARMPGLLAPEKVIFTDQIPRDIGGVINRVRLRRQYSIG